MLQTVTITSLRKKYNHPWGWASLALLLLFCSCSVKNDNCEIDTDVFLYVGFYDSTQKVCTLSYVTAYGQDNDSILYNAATTAQLALPLNPSATETNYILAFGDNIKTNDTLSFEYNNQQWFLSMECGGIVKHHLTSVKSSQHFIDSIKVDENDIVNENKIHVKLYVTP